MTMSSPADRIEALRQAALAKVRAEEYGEALVIYDQALALAPEEESRELITINKADALIASQQPGAEIEALPKIIMRRRNSRHVYLAAYALQYKNHLDGNGQRAIFYGQVALRAAEESGEKSWERPVHLELGNIYIEQSMMDQAAESYARVLEYDRESADNRDLALSRAAALEGLGYCRVSQGKFEEGIAMMLEALPHFTTPFHRAETLVDLCFAYLELEQFERSREYGLAALEISSDQRHTRNAHYLLGEVAYKMGDVDTASYHFDELARFYPQFRNLKSLLFAIDLRSMVNFRL